jgi:predicted O-methyltransferase YrrM
MRRIDPRALLERVGLPLLYAGLGVARLYRPSFHRTSRHVYRVADRLGVFPVIDHYHDPPVRPELGRRRDRRLPGIDLRVDKQLKLLEEFDYADELRAIPSQAGRSLSPYYENPSFAPVDGAVYHCLLRHFKPRRVVEVGSGQSTRFAANALAMNSVEGHAGELLAIEPYESPELERLGVTVIRRRVEDVGDAVFRRLRAGDVLFIDSSHVVRPGGDVAYLLLEVVPALAPGVVVHIHDVFTPDDYPAEWSRRRWFWTEQYVVEALLTYNAKLEIILTVHHLLTRHPERLHEALPVPPGRIPGPTPGSLWLRTKEQS